MTNAQPPPPPGAPAAGPPVADTGPHDAPAARQTPSIAVASRPPRAGQLTTAWQIMVAVAWSAAFFSLAAVWKASEEVGIATWWLGPRADPQPVLVRIFPFLIVAAVALCAVYNLRFVPWVSLAGSVAIGVIAAIDLSYMTGLAIAEFAIVGALGLVSVASFGGRYRFPAEPPAAAEQQPGELPDPVSSPGDLPAAR